MSDSINFDIEKSYFVKFYVADYLDGLHARAIKANSNVLIELVDNNNNYYCKLLELYVGAKEQVIFLRRSTWDVIPLLSASAHIHVKSFSLYSVSIPNLKSLIHNKCCNSGGVGYIALDENHILQIFHKCDRFLCFGARTSEHLELAACITNDLRLLLYSTSDFDDMEMFLYVLRELMDQFSESKNHQGHDSHGLVCSPILLSCMVNNRRRSLKSYLEKLEFTILDQFMQIKLNTAEESLDNNKNTSNFCSGGRSGEKEVNSTPSTALSAATRTLTSTDDPNSTFPTMDTFILLGQSNMSGRGRVSDLKSFCEYHRATSLHTPSTVIPTADKEEVNDTTTRGRDRFWRHQDITRYFSPLSDELADDYRNRVLLYDPQEQWQYA